MNGMLFACVMALFGLGCSSYPVVCHTQGGLLLVDVLLLGWDDDYKGSIRPLEGTNERPRKRISFFGKLSIAR